MERAIRHPIVFGGVESTGGVFETLLIVGAICIALYAIGAWVISAFSDVISTMLE
jgi:hypothetical protein